MRMMDRAFAPFQYGFTIQPRYFFLHKLDDGLTHYIVFQRDGDAGAFYMDLAVPMSPNWRGVSPAGTAGKWNSLQQIKAGHHSIDAMDHWYFYRNSRRGFLRFSTRFHLIWMSSVCHISKRLLSNFDQTLPFCNTASQSPGHSARDLEAWERLNEHRAYCCEQKNSDFIRLRDRLLRLQRKGLARTAPMGEPIAWDLLWCGIGS